MLGRSSCFAKECFQGNFIGVDSGINEDLTGQFTDDWHDFNQKYIPVYLEIHPDKTKTSAGLACGFMYTVCKDLKIGDTVLCPDGNGNYYVGTIESDYYYVPGTNLPHRRKVTWLNKTIKRSDMSKEAQNSLGSIGTCSNVTRFADEIETLIKGSAYVAPTKPNAPQKTHYNERDLHKIFCNYLRTENIFGKTIYHEKSSNKSDSNQKWVHPDIVGVKFEDFKEEATSALQKVMETKKVVSLCSYELKRTIEDDYQLKQYFFQALSNSSWANYGFLVAYEIDESLHEEIQRLNAAFGIGVILLQAKATDVKILCQAKEKELDYDTIDKLCHLNPDFKSFIEKLTRVMNAPNDYTNDSMLTFKKNCDEIFKDNEELEDYCRANCIPF